MRRYPYGKMVMLNNMRARFMVLGSSIISKYPNTLITVSDDFMEILINVDSIEFDESLDSSGTLEITRSASNHIGEDRRCVIKFSDVRDVDEAIDGVKKFIHKNCVNM